MWYHDTMTKMTFITQSYLGLQFQGTVVHGGRMKALEQELEAASSHLELQGWSKECPQEIGVFKLSEPTSSEVCLLSLPPNSTSNWESSSQISKTMGDIFYSSHHKGLYQNGNAPVIFLILIPQLKSDLHPLPRLNEIVAIHSSTIPHLGFTCYFFLACPSSYAHRPLYTWLQLPYNCFIFTLYIRLHFDFFPLGIQTNILSHDMGSCLR